MIRPADAITATLALEAGAIHGEGPCWSVERRRLYWVDIEGRAVHAFDPSTGRDEALPFSEEPTAVAPREHGGLVVAVRSGFVLTDADGRIERRVPIEAADPWTRMNDGSCDPLGRFWAGTMDVDEGKHRGIASLYRLDPDLRVERVLEGVTISNGAAWTPDGGTLYYIDTPTRRIRSYACVDGRLGDARVVAGIPGPGLPDGMTIDGEGALWVALYGGGAVCRCDPRTGEVARRVEVPGAEQVSSCAFGGDGLRRLYITTSRRGLDGEALRRQPHAGALFVADVGVAGQPSRPFAG